MIVLADQISIVEKANLSANQKIDAGAKRAAVNNVVSGLSRFEEDRSNRNANQKAGEAALQ